ncbi:MAG: thermonuclease family protein [Chitinophagaceae bacterium]|nr:thermonuclease family protein [Chitinophagaceae bacterium]
MYEYKATVKRIIDGDSLVLDIDLGFYMFMNETKIRLYGLDTPEMNSEDPLLRLQAVLATRYLYDNLKVGDKVIIKTVLDKREKYGRLLGTIFTKGGVNINEGLLQNRLAVTYKGLSREEQIQKHYENQEYLIQQGFIIE